VGVARRIAHLGAVFEVKEGVSSNETGPRLAREFSCGFTAEFRLCHASPRFESPSNNCNMLKYYIGDIKNEMFLLLGKINTYCW